VKGVASGSGAVLDAHVPAAFRFAARRAIRLRDPLIRMDVVL
jgi:hypothetical protein